MRYARYLGYALVAIVGWFATTVRVSDAPVAVAGTVFVQEPGAAKRTSDEVALRSTLTRAMDICGTPTLSPARRAVIADQMVRIAMSHDVPHEYREAFIGVVCLESRFNTEAKSTAGALGLAQIMPQYAQNFANLCKMGTLAPDDVRDPEVNLRLGACLYFNLLDHFQGNRVLAGAAYNSGMDSKTTKAIGKLSTGHPETSGWLTKFFALDEQLNKTKDNK